MYRTIYYKQGGTFIDNIFETLDEMSIYIESIRDGGKRPDALICDGFDNLQYIYSKLWTPLLYLIKDSNLYGHMLYSTKYMLRILKSKLPEYERLTINTKDYLSLFNGNE